MFGTSLSTLTVLNLAVSFCCSWQAKGWFLPFLRSNILLSLRVPSSWFFVVAGILLQTIKSSWIPNLLCNYVPSILKMSFPSWSVLVGENGLIESKNTGFILGVCSWPRTSEFLTLVAFSLESSRGESGVVSFLLDPPDDVSFSRWLLIKISFTLRFLGLGLP